MLEGVVEKLLGRFVGTSIFAEDDGGEVIEKSAGMELLVLHFVESVAAHMHAITFPSEVIHQFLCPIHQARLDGTKGEKLVAGFPTIINSRVESFSKTQRMTETFHDEIITLNLPFGILCPKSDVRVPIVIVEDIGVVEVLIQMQVLIQFAQGDDGIAVGVVECVIEVDE